MKQLIIVHPSFDSDFDGFEQMSSGTNHRYLLEQYKNDNEKNQHIIDTLQIKTENIVYSLVGYLDVPMVNGNKGSLLETVLARGRDIVLVGKVLTNDFYDYENGDNYAGCLGRALTDLVRNSPNLRISLPNKFIYRAPWSDPKMTMHEFLSSVGYSVMEDENGQTIVPTISV
jgi:hypothetical protein